MGKTVTNMNGISQIDKKLSKITEEVESMRKTVVQSGSRKDEGIT